MGQDVVSTPGLRQLAVATLTRFYPLLSGCGTVANTGVIRALAADTNDAVWARVAGGYSVLVRLDDYIGRAVFYMGDLDRKVSEICRRIVRPGDTVLDIGANIGVVTFCLSALVGQRGQVHAFEPNPPMVDALERAVRKNAVENVVLHPCALGEEEGSLDLIVPRGNAGRGSFSRSTDPLEKRVAVPVVPLSRILRERAVRAIRLVKIDVEGFEPQVLRGAREAFAENPPDGILFELNDLEGRLADHPTVRLLTEMGFSIFRIPRALVRLKLVEADLTSSEPLKSHDFLAIHRGPRHADVVARVT